MTRIRTPKQNGRAKASSWYGYYAGYSTSFIEDVLEDLALPPGAKILDPWNGSGTTTTLASRKGFVAIGFDVNPVLVVVSKARLLGSEIVSSLPTLTDEILSRVHSRNGQLHLSEHDPLCRWFSNQSASWLRALERGIYHVLVGLPDLPDVAERVSLKPISDLAAFYYVVLFKVVRRNLRKFTTSNPTWIKTAKIPQQRLTLSPRVLDNEFQETQQELAKLLCASGPSGPVGWRGRAWIEVANSRELPIPDRHVDAVVSSPPYCTRIDYAIATLPELSVLGFSQPEFIDQLRYRTLGSPLTSKDVLSADANWGPTCLEFLDRVAAHSSKASKTYYHRHYSQYFAGLYRSLAEIQRTLREGSHCALVVQDSFYKEIRNDLPRIVCEMVVSLGWRLEDRLDFPVRLTKAAIHKESRRYRSDFSATESLLIFSTPEQREPSWRQ